jgi:hypothetical protein
MYIYRKHAGQTLHFKTFDISFTFDDDRHNLYILSQVTETLPFKRIDIYFISLNKEYKLSVLR